MDRLRSPYHILLFLFIPMLGTAQADSTVLTFNDFFQLVLDHHPIVRQANLQIQRGEAKRLEARGGLDPQISSNYDQKDFDEKLYYRLFQGSLKVPTALGIDLVAGYENTSGIFLNPENSTDQFGLWNLGIEANLIQGLIVNERRTALQQAEVFQSLADNEREVLTNQVLFDAAETYLMWQNRVAIDSVLQGAIALAEIYLDNTRQSYLGGEKAAIDTIEAYVILQDALTRNQQNKVEIIKARQELQNYLWFNGVPIEFQNDARPQTTKWPILNVRSLEDSSALSGRHPLILSKLNKLNIEQLERRLKQEKLKPKLKAKYNPLLFTEDNLIPNYTTTNFKFGVEFSMPMFFRAERARLEMSEIKIQEMLLDVANTENRIINKLENSLRQQDILEEQIRLQELNVANYLTLLNSESEKFNFGESSVFLLNKRQEKYIDGQIKLIELNMKLQLERLKYFFYDNRLTRI